MSKRYSGKSFKDSSIMKKAKLKTFLFRNKKTKMTNVAKIRIKINITIRIIKYK